MGSKGVRFKNQNGDNIYPCPYYPVGSIYMSVDNTNPSTYFGGTWVQLENVFLLGASSTHQAGETGGEEKHTLTIQEMPSHRHEAKFGDVAGGDGSGYRYSNSLGQNGAIVQPAGGGQAHNNMPPYLAVYIWKRTA